VTANTKPNNESSHPAAHVYPPAFKESILAPRNSISDPGGNQIVMPLYFTNATPHQCRIQYMNCPCRKVPEIAAPMIMHQDRGNDLKNKHFSNNLAPLFPLFGSQEFF
jgi:hypothetical protein